jgi:uncharacterized protein with FMN-binding domain
VIPRRGVIAIAGTLIALVLLLGYRTPDRPLADATLAVAPAKHPAAATAPVAVGATGPGTTGTTPAKAAGYTGTVTGPVVATPFGNVQVQATFAAGRITSIATLQTPSDQRRSQMIADYAVPILRSEALSAQTAQVSMVSGATYTSDGYLQSLQAALDQAKA